MCSSPVAPVLWGRVGGLPELISHQPSSSFSKRPSLKDYSEEQYGRTPSILLWTAHTYAQAQVRAHPPAHALYINTAHTQKKEKEGA